MHICQHCSKECPNPNSHRNHERTCPNNPSRIYKNGMTGKTAWNKGLTSADCEITRKRGEAVKQRFASGELKPSGCCAEGWQDTDEAKIAYPEGSRGGFREGAGRGKKTKFKNIVGEEFLLRSSFELKLAELLNQLNINWTQPKSFTYKLGNKTHRYYPDFFLPDYDLIIETKNDYLYSLQIDKMNAVSEYSEYPILLLLNKDMENLEEVIRKELIII